MAYIDKDLLLKDISESVVFSVKGSCSPELRGARKIIDRIKNAPTAGVAEVVRCSECRLNVANMEKDGYDTTDYSGEDIVCSYFMTDGMLPDDFCSFGERKDA